MPVTFDGPNRLIIADFGTTNLDAEQELYSAWKVFALAGDNLKFFPAYRTIGGDPIGGGLEAGAFFFLQNQVQPDGGVGWRIRPHEADHELTVVGNQFPESDSFAQYVPTLGGFTVLIRTIVSSFVLGVDSTAINEAVWLADANFAYPSGTTGEYLYSGGIVSSIFNRLFGPLFSK